MIQTQEEIICDFCGNTDNHCESIRISAKNYDVCPACIDRLSAVMNWKETKEQYVSFNFNHEVEATLAKDGVEAYNLPYGIPELERKGKDRATEGKVIKTPLHNFCQLMIPAFEKMKGSYQGVCLPFELRFQIGSLKLQEPHNK